jgi:hypothetical protein
MDCEERLLTQAKMVKGVNPTAKVFVYRNLVKALPWYTSVREKITDPAYAGWFLPFSKKPPVNGTSWHMSKCTGDKCTDLYHDLEQTPVIHPNNNNPSRVKEGDWYIYNNTNDVSGCHPGWKTITQGGPQTDWKGCKASADAAKKKGFTWWVNPNAKNGTCWLVDGTATAILLLLYCYCYTATAILLLLLLLLLY